jgi:hypothetical protein
MSMARRKYIVRNFYCGLGIGNIFRFGYDCSDIASRGEKPAFNTIG